ncbi:MAG: histidine kinase [Eubacteriales bacterium]|nr:histidine kinase [Eubacteriales bacterium]
MVNLLKKIKQGYSDMKLQSKFTLALMLTVTVPVLMLGLFFYGRLYDMVVSYTISQEQDTSAKTAPLIEDTVQEVVDTTSRLSELEFYKTLFHNPISTPMSMIVNTEQAARFRSQVESMIDGSLITGIRFYVDLPNESSELFTSPNTKDIFAPMIQAKGTYWNGIFEGTTGLSELFCPSFYLGTQEQAKYGDMAYIRTSSIYYRSTPYKVFVAVYYSSDKINSILDENLSLDGSVSYIINDRNNLVASSNTSLSGIYWLDYNTIEDSFMSSNNFIERNILGNTIYAGFYSITHPDWFMVTVLPSGPLIHQSNMIMIQFIMFYLGFLVLAFLLANLLSHSITNRISSVISQMNTVRQGPPVAMESPQAHDEVGDLIDTYNFMARKMNQLIENQAKAAEDLRIAEFNSLQAQINPHFLYNTMDMINWLAQQGRTSEISNAVQNLSRFYKLTLSRKQSISTISQEEEHVSIYVRLQNMRYHDSIELISDIPDELMDYQIPKLTLQPVIENAILHGILEKDSKAGTIVLTGWMEDEDIVLLISDDGVGISPEKMPTILSGTGQSSSGGTNIAIYNTHRRLQILYGSKYGLQYTSEPEKGTEVQIRIPAQKEYQNPYLQSSQPPAERSALSLVTVSNHKNTPDVNAVTPQKLLDYSQKLTQNLYNVHTLHHISEKLPPDENLYILSHEVTCDFPNHTHDYFEINYVCSGSLINVIDGNELYMSAGDLVILNQTAVHSLRYQQPGTVLINFCLMPGAFRRTLKSFYEDDNLISDFIRGESPIGRNYIFFSLGHNIQAQTLLTSIIQEYADNGFHQSFALEAFYLLLFSYLSASEEFSYYGTDCRTHEMIEYLKANCLNRKREEIAAHFQYSPEQLDSHLKERTGQDYKSFAAEVRLEHAIELLADPNMNIYQIVENCGFTDVEEFFDIFHKKFHISPTDYRKQFL